MRNMHTRYGSLLVKKCVDTVNGQKVLSLELPEWKNTTTDQIDIANGVIIEEHYLLPSELNQKTAWSNVGEAIELAQKENEKRYNGRRIRVFEVRGRISRSFIKEITKEEITDKDKKRVLISTLLSIWSNR